MVTSGVILAFIGTLLFKFSNSAAIDYEPIKIIVNENFNAQPGQVSSELQALEPGVLHQGANFYFKPQVNLPQSFIPSHIEALMSFIQQHQSSYSKDPSKFAAEKNKLMDILKLFMYPSSDISKETPSKIVFEKENNLGNVKPREPNPPALALEEIVAEPQPVPAIITEEPKPVAELLVIPEAPVLPPLSLSSVHPPMEEEVKYDETAILEEQTGAYPTIPEITVRPIQEPIFTYVQTKPMTSELMIIPEAPVLPSLSFNGIPSNVKKEIIKEESVITEAQRGVFPTISGIAVRPIQESIINYDESKTATSELGHISDASVLSQTDNSNPEEPVISYVEPKPIITEIEVIPEVPVLPPLSANDIKLVEEEMKIEEPILVDVDSKHAIQELEEIIPEAPVSSPLVLHDVPYIVKEEVRKEESELLKEPTGVFPTGPEAAVRPVQELIFNYAEPKPFITEFQVIPEAPVLPPLSANDITLVEEGMKIEEPIVVGVESKPAIQELEEVIPEAPVLPPLVLHDVPYIVKEEVKKDESELMKEPTGVFSTGPEAAVRPVQELIFNYDEPKPFITEFQVIPEAPVLPPLSANDITFVEEGMKIGEPIVVDVESKPAIQELEEVIPEAPVLPPLVHQDVPSIIKEDVKKEESEILKEPTGVFPIIPEIAGRPVQEPIFNYVEPKPFITEFQVIPEAPILPPLSANDITLVEEGMKVDEPIVVDVQSKPAIQELEEIIPEAPVLPPLVLHDVPYIVKEEVRKEESELLKEPTGVFPTGPQAAVRPVQELIFNYAEPKPFITEFQVIPEAPVLPPLSVNDITLVEEGMKIEEPIVVDVESKPAIQELEEVIPEAPVLPPLVHQDVPSIIKEEVKKEELEILKEPTGVFPIIPEIAGRPVQEPIFNYVEPKPFITEFQVIPEAPILPPLSANDITLVEEGIKVDEPIVVDVQSKPAIQELEEIIPEAPVLSPLVLHDVPYIVKEQVRKDESELLKEPTVVFPIIPEAAVRPVQEPIFNYAEPKPFITESQVIPEAPVLSSLSTNGFKLIESGVKIEEPNDIVVDPKLATSELGLIPEAPILLPVSNIPLVEDVLSEETTTIAEYTDRPSIPEIFVRPIEPELAIIDVEPKPVKSNLIVMPEAFILPALSFNGKPSVGEEVKTEEPIKIEESTGMFTENSARPISEPITVSAKHFVLENNNSPVATKVKIEIPILLKESIEVFPPIAERLSEPTLEPIQELKMTNSYVLEEVSQQKPEHVAQVKETLPPRIIPKPSNTLGVFSYAPFVSHLSNRAAKMKKLTIPKAASLERFLLKKYPFKFPSVCK